MRALFAILMTALAIAFGGAPPKAHEMQPAIVDVGVVPDGDLVITIKTNLEAFLAEIGPEHADSNDAPTAADYDRLRALDPAALQTAFEAAQGTLIGALDVRVDGEPVDLIPSGVVVPPVGDVGAARRSTVVLVGAAGLPSRVLVWRNDRRFGDAVLRVSDVREARPYYAALIKAGEASEPVALDLAPAQTTLDVLRLYVVSGFDHIVPKGLDHILFVIGLFLLSARWRPLLMQITCFTLAHTITLALGATGTVRLSPDIVEPLIALSIAVVALENLFTDRLGPWRPFVVFGFGLLHGLGFAGVLADFGLPEGQFLPALVAFNVGVEAGQLAVIAACYLAVGFWFSGRSWYRRAVVYPASIAIAAVALFWTVERIGIV